MINALIQSSEGATLITEFPRDIYNLYEELQSVGIRSLPSKIKLTDDEDAPVQVKLYSDSDIGNHLILLMSENNNLEDVDTIVSSVMKADDRIKDELEQAIIYDQYSSPDELYQDIRQMTYDLGTVSESYYFPLVGQLYDEEYDDSEIVHNSFLTEYQDEIQEALEKYSDPTTENMAEYYHDIGKDKLLLADWSVTEIKRTLYGKVDIRLTEPLAAEETEKLKDWIKGQNSDGLGEGFEQRDIETSEGMLNVSFWNSGKDYFIYDREEIDRYTEQISSPKLGGI